MESCICLLKRLAYKEEKFPSNKMATGTWPFVNVRMSSSDFTDCKLTMAGVLIVLLLVSLANKIVFVIPLAFTVSIVFRIIFITVGVALVEEFHWILYLFGAFLLYTGIKMFKQDEEKEFDPHQNKVYTFLNKILPLNPTDGNGRFIVYVNKKPQYSILFVVVVILASIDLVFALDSIPAVMGISQDRLVIYTSNIFAVLGLRSLFFLLRGAVNKFKYLQHGIAIVLVVIGLKMLAEKFIDQFITKNEQVIYSLLAILICIGGAVAYSIIDTRKNKK